MAAEHEMHVVGNWFYDFILLVYYSSTIVTSSHSVWNCLLDIVQTIWSIKYIRGKILKAHYIYNEDNLC